MKQNRIARYSLATIFIVNFLPLSTVVFADSNNGQYSALDENWDVIPLHVTLTPQGDIIGFGGTPGTGQDGMEYEFWSPTLGDGPSSHQLLPNTTPTNIFCAAQLILPFNDQLLIMGGWMQDKKAFNFIDPLSREIEAAGVLATPMGRYYASSIVLPDGKVLLLGGSTNNATGPAIITPEIFDPPVNSWQSLVGAMSEPAFGNDNKKWWYPRAWVAPDGRVFGISAQQMFWLEVDNNGDIELAGTLTGTNWGATSTAVMYRPGKILQVGGGWFDNSSSGSPNGSKSASVIDINSSNPLITSATPMHLGRHWANSVVLPDGKVLVTGGSSENNSLAGTVGYKPEIWDPDTDTWTLLDASDPKARLYHSASILLPDGRVFTGGGGIPGPQNNDNGATYSPPYLFSSNGSLANRPIIQNAPGAITWQDNFNVQVANGTNIDRVTLIKTGAVTHSFNFEQRFIELDFYQTGNTLNITAPENAYIATPGYYLLFVLNSSGVPSVAKIIKLDASTANVPPVFLNPGQQTSTVNNGVSLSLSASDPDGGVITFSATGLPDGLSLNQVTGIIDGIPTVTGIYTVIAIATDDESDSITHNFTWEIVNQGTLISDNHWPFENNADDIVGSNNGMLFGDATFVSDSERGFVLSVDGNGDHVSAANTTTADFSFSLWIKTSANSLSGKRAYHGNSIIWADVSGPNNDFILTILKNKIAFWDGSDNVSLKGSTILNDNSWHHIAATRQAGGDINLYVDGILDANRPAGSFALTGSPIIAIGGNVFDENKSFNGLIDDVRQFNSVLTPSQVQALAAGGTAGPGY